MVPFLAILYSRYCMLLIQVIALLGKILDEKRMVIAHRKKLQVVGKECLLNIFPRVEQQHKGIVSKLFKSTAFIPAGMRTAWNLAADMYFSKR